MGVEGDPLHVMLIETKDGRYLLSENDIDKCVAEANDRRRCVSSEVAF